jgi:hypothetical protein
MRLHQLLREFNEIDRKIKKHQKVETILKIILIGFLLSEKTKKP